MYDIIIVGAGTAGISAAIYGLRAGKTVLVLEEKTYGGQIIVTPEIENYPGIAKISGYEFAQGLYEQAKNLGMEIQYGRVTQVIRRHAQQEVSSPGNSEANVQQELEAASVKVHDGTKPSSADFLVKVGEKEYVGRSVIFATGAKNRPLDIDREQEFVGQGISYCATCDGRFYKDRVVGVVGGGNTALEDALFLSEYCRYVYLIHRREEFRGEPQKLAALKERDNVELVLNSVVTAIAGEDYMEGVHVWDRKKKEEKLLPVSGLFVAIGQMPDNDAFSSMVSVDDKGYIIAGEDCRTDTEGVFTAGDCRTKQVRQLTTAAADGAVAALAACEYISEKM